MPFYVNTENSVDNRFNFPNFIEFKNNVYDTMDSVMTGEIRKLPSAGVYNVRSLEDQRPDLVSYNIYGTIEYWWIILRYNGMIDFTKLRGDTTINFPSERNIDDLYLEMKRKQNLQDSDN